VKRQTCIYIEDEVIRACKEQGVNMSAVAEKAFRAILTGQHFRDEEAHLEFLRTQKVQVRKQLRDRTELVNIANAKLKRLETQIKAQEELVSIIRKSKQVSSLIASINDVIKSYQYDVEQAWKECQPLLQNLEELEHPVNREWFEQQVERLRTGFID